VQTTSDYGLEEPESNNISIDNNNIAIKHQALYSKIDNCLKKSELVFHQSINATANSDIPRKSNAASGIINNSKVQIQGTQSTVNRIQLF